jgi:hypothetical protein
LHKVEAASKLLEVSGTSALKLLHKVEAASKLLEVSLSCLLGLAHQPSSSCTRWRSPPSYVSLSFLLSALKLLHKVEAASKLLEVSGTSALKLLHKVEAASKLLEVSLSFLFGLAHQPSSSCARWRPPPSYYRSVSPSFGTSALKLLHKVEAASKLLEVSLSFLWHISPQALAQGGGRLQAIRGQFLLPVSVGTSVLKLLHKVEAASKLLEVSLSLPVRVGISALKLLHKVEAASKILEVSLSFL